MTSVFLDGNILVYAYSGELSPRSCPPIIGRRLYCWSQTFNEFSCVARRKLKLAWDRVDRASFDISESADAVLSTQLIDHRQSLYLAERYRLSVFDALMLAIALRAGCSTFCSEDTHHGLLIEDQFTIIDPFR